MTSAQTSQRSLIATATFNLGRIPAKRTDDCLSGPQWARRPHLLSDRFPDMQPETGPCQVVVLSPERNSTFAEWAAEVLDVEPETDAAFMSRRLEERNHLMTFPQAQQKIATSDLDEDGLVLNLSPGRVLLCAYMVFFFVKMREDDPSVGVGFIFPNGKQLDSHADRLERSNPWPTTCHLLIPNLDLTRFVRKGQRGRL